MLKCPEDGERLLMSERQDVEIDYRPKCRGIWLDRGELDKLMSGANDNFGGQNRRYRDDDDDGIGDVLGRVLGGLFKL
jgi:hypothetical protein